MAEHARQAAYTEVDKMLDELGEARPESVTVQSVSGTPAEELINAARDADMIVVGSRGGRRIRPAADGIGQYPGRPPRARPGLRDQGPVNCRPTPVTVGT